MATHSSILAWKIQWTEEPGRLQSVGLQRVRYNWAHVHARAHTHTHTHTHCDLVGGHLKLHFKLWWKKIVCSLLCAGSCTHIQAHICIYTQRTRWNFKLWSADIKWHYQFFGLLYLLVSGGTLKPLSKTVMSIAVCKFVIFCFNILMLCY